MRRAGRDQCDSELDHFNGLGGTVCGSPARTCVTHDSSFVNGKGATLGDIALRTVWRIQYESPPLRVDLGEGEWDRN